MITNKESLESFINFCNDMEIAEESRKETSSIWNETIKKYKNEWRESRKCIRDKDWDGAINHLKNAIKICEELKKQLPNHPNIPISENLIAIFKPSQWFKSSQTQHVESGYGNTVYKQYEDYYSKNEHRSTFKNLQLALNLKIKDCEVQIGYLTERKKGKGFLKARLSNHESY